MMRKMFSFLTNRLHWDNFVRGFIEGRTVDFHERYADIARIIREVFKDTGIRVLDIGSGGCSPLAYMGFNVTSLDIKSIKGVYLVASATQLPFRDRSFDTVVLCDVIEHIKSTERKSALTEAKRVTQRLIIIHVPLNDNQRFKSEYYDFLLYYFLKTRRNPPYEWKRGLREHLTHGEPTLKFFIREDFRLVTPDWNVKVWYAFMRFGVPSRGLLNRFAFTLYYLMLRFIKSPPYWGGFLVYGV